MEKIINKEWYRTDEFEIVDEWPDGYFIWNIGRENFPYPEYIPLAKSGNLPHHVDLSSLKAFKAPSEEIALKCMQAAIMTYKRDFYKEDYLKIIGDK